MEPRVTGLGGVGFKHRGAGIAWLATFARNAGRPHGIVDPFDQLGQDGVASGRVVVEAVNPRYLRPDYALQSTMAGCTARVIHAVVE
jgi:hypothetical protein